jgi:hypothetical protein
MLARLGALQGESLQDEPRLRIPCGKIRQSKRLMTLMPPPQLGINNTGNPPNNAAQFSNYLKKNLDSEK